MAEEKVKKAFAAMASSCFDSHEIEPGTCALRGEITVSIRLMEQDIKPIIAVSTTFR
jgi:hypothetical protein